MENFNKVWRIFFAVSLIAIAVEQVVLSSFMPVMLPAWALWLTGSIIFIWIASILLVLASAAIILDYKARPVAVYLGVIFLLMLIVFHVPFQLHSPMQFLGAWGNAFKIFAYAGGAFVVASSIPKTGTENGLTIQLEKLLPLGRFLFSITIVVFGIEHFMYTPFVAMLIPDWIPGHLFWTYFAGTALILSGLAIILNIQQRLAANLLGLMIFLWFIMLHIPRAVASTPADHGNEWASVFESFGFSGIAFLIASMARPGGK
jgi:uncharacterized membrane protein YphA (DoxX/SURF4 family)